MKILIGKVLNELHACSPIKPVCAHMFNLPLRHDDTRSIISPNSKFNSASMHFENPRGLIYDLLGLVDEEKYQNVDFEKLVEVCLYVIKMWGRIWSSHALYCADILLIYISCS